MSTSAVLPELAGDEADLMIGDVARLSGLSIDTLRYWYEHICGTSGAD